MRLKISLADWPISTRTYFKVSFFVLTLLPYSTVSFNIILFKLTCTKTLCLSFKGKKQNCSIFVRRFLAYFLMQKSQKRLYTVKTLLKIKILLSLITHKRVETFQKFQRFWVCPVLSFNQLRFENNWLENKVALLKKPKILKFPYLVNVWRNWHEILVS